MSERNGVSPAAPAPEPLPAVRRLLRRIVQGVLRYRWLIGATFLLGWVEAVCTKMPLLLIQPFVDAVQARAPGGPGGFGSDLLERINAFILEFSHWFVGLTGWWVGGGEATPQKIQITGAIVLMVLVAIPGALATYGVLVMSRYFAARIVVDLRNEVAAHLLRLPLRFFGKQRMGDLISRLTANTTALSRAFELAVDHAIVDPMLIAMNFVIVWVMVPEAALVLLAMLPLMALPMIRLGRRVQRSSKKSLSAMGEATESLNQMLSGIKTVKAFQLEEHRQKEFVASNERYLGRTRRMLEAKAMSQSAVYVIYQAGSAVLLVAVGWFVIEANHSIGAIAAVSVTMATTYQHVKRLSRAFNTLLESAGALEAIESVIDEPVDVAARGGGVALGRLRGEVAMERVTFSYGAEPAVSELSFHVAPGQTVALVGPSGGGKSTTLDLLMRFHDPQAGRILVDGHDLRELDLASYRRQTAVVSQHPFLFNTTILENIRCGRPDASFEEVVDAAKAAQIHSFIETLPEDYQTVAGERGCNLSGGQMQRITIARALLRDPAILFLDEAMSALDSESEALVQQALGNLMRGRTCFVIAHRLATIRSADVILVLDQGRLVEKGTHEELLTRPGIYSRLTQLQQLA